MTARRKCVILSATTAVSLIKKGEKQMNINISENIKNNRQLKGITQEELASALGVSPQAISKWERGDGYPDITTLPAIAGFFEISIDELMGFSGENEKRLEQNFNGEIAEKTNGEAFEIAKKYHEKYPKNKYFAWCVVDNFRHIVDKKLRDKNISLLRECCKKTFEMYNGDEYRRRTAAQCMAVFGDDRDLDEYIGVFPSWYQDTKNELIEEREWQSGEHWKSRIDHIANDIGIILHLLTRKRRYYGKPKMALDSNMWKYDLVRSLGGGKIPEGFCGWEAPHLMRIAAAYFGLGQNDDGFEWLEKSLCRYEENKNMMKEKADVDGIITLDLGKAFDLLYLQIKKDRVRLVSVDGDPKVNVTIALINAIIPDNSEAYSYLTASRGWEWFDGVRCDPRFIAAVERAKKIAEK